MLDHVQDYPLPTGGCLLQADWPPRRQRAPFHPLLPEGRRGIVGIFVFRVPTSMGPAPTCTLYTPLHPPGLSIGTNASYSGPYHRKLVNHIYDVPGSTHWRSNAPFTRVPFVVPRSSTRRPLLCRRTRRGSRGKRVFKSDIIAWRSTQGEFNSDDNASRLQGLFVMCTLDSLGIPYEDAVSARPGAYLRRGQTAPSLRL